MKVLEITSNKNLKSHVLLGSAYCLKACLQKQHSQQISFYEKALDTFKKFWFFFSLKKMIIFICIIQIRANSLDPSDYIPLYHIGHCYSILRQVLFFLFFQFLFLINFYCYLD